MHICILPQCSTTAASVLNSAGMDAQFERSCCAISRGILKCGEFITNALARDIAINDPDEVKIIISFSHAKDEIGIMCFRAGRVLSTRAETQSVETIREVNTLLEGRVRNEHGHFRSSYESLQDIIQRIEKGK